MRKWQRNWLLFLRMGMAVVQGSRRVRKVWVGVFCKVSIDGGKLKILVTL